MSNFTVSAVKDAMGRCDGDHLVLKNKWAEVTVTFDKGYDSAAPYTVEGDCERRYFTSLNGALGYALDELAKFAE
jgi:hypothetical protein